MPGTFFSPELAADIAAACAAELGVRPTVAGPSAVDPSRLPAAGGAVSADTGRWKDRWGPITCRPIPFAPVVGGDVRPATPWQALAGGAGRDVGLLVGHTRDEHRLFSLIDGVLGQVTGQRRLAVRMPTLHLARAHAASGGRAHLYELTWPAPGMGGVLGACHGLDVPLVFGNLTSGQPARLIGGTPSAQAEALSARIRAAWAAFAALPLTGRQPPEGAPAPPGTAGRVGVSGDEPACAGWPGPAVSGYAG